MVTLKNKPTDQLHFLFRNEYNKEQELVLVLRMQLFVLKTNQPVRNYNPAYQSLDHGTAFEASSNSVQNRDKLTLVQNGKHGFLDII
jgi:hypothetical protein